MFDGTNYLPVRALSESLGMDVSWDGKTNTVVLTSENKLGYDPLFSTYAFYMKTISAAASIHQFCMMLSSYVEAKTVDNKTVSFINSYYNDTLTPIVNDAAQYAGGNTLYKNLFNEADIAGTAVMEYLYYVQDLRNGNTSSTHYNSFYTALSSETDVYETVSDNCNAFANTIGTAAKQQ